VRKFVRETCSKWLAKGVPRKATCFLDNRRDADNFLHFSTVRGYRGD